VGAKHFTELIAWQLAAELHNRIIELTSRPEVSKDKGFCDDIMRSSRSVKTNTSEGFGSYYHREFAAFLNVARRSLLETQNHLIEAKDRRFLGSADFEDIWRLTIRTQVAVARLRAYLTGRGKRRPPEKPGPDHGP
jgi:four helix bundle protein